MLNLPNASSSIFSMSLFSSNLFFWSRRAFFLAFMMVLEKFRRVLRHWSYSWVGPNSRNKKCGWSQGRWIRCITKSVILKHIVQEVYCMKCPKRLCCDDIYFIFSSLSLCQGKIIWISQSVTPPNRYLVQLSCWLDTLWEFKVNKYSIQIYSISTSYRLCGIISTKSRQIIAKNLE